MKGGAKKYHHFFKIFLPEQHSHTMKVPKEFLKNLNEDLSSNAVLSSPSSGEKWQVSVLKKGSEVYMQNGWPQFVTDNSVVLHEVLLFTYHGDNCFHVQIFGTNGLERLCLKETTQEQATIPNKTTPTSAPSSLHKSKSCKKDLSLPKEFPTPQHSIEIESSEALKLAKSFTSCKPHWKHVMTKCHVEGRCILPIATKFARKYIPEEVKHIHIGNSEGTLWKVQVNYFKVQGRNYANLTTGWAKFVRDNKLMKGDTCIFELQEDLHLKVHIFRTRCAPS